MKARIAVAIAAVIFAGAGWWFVANVNVYKTNTAPTSGAVSTTSARVLKPPREAPVGFHEYRNEHYRFALFYPSDLAVNLHDEGTGASTITFQNTDSGKGFQIFILPYAAPQVSTERFKKDVPSGVRKESVNVTVDGAFGTMFLSEQSLLGPTREIWVIHDGYLFEISTLKPLDSWLQSIMASFQFL